MKANRTTKGQPNSSAEGRDGTTSEQSRPWHTLSADETARALQIDPATGLSSDEAVRRRTQFGPNILNEIKGRSLFAILVDQFRSLIVALRWPRPLSHSHSAKTSRRSPSWWSSC